MIAYIYVCVCVSVCKGVLQGYALTFLTTVRAG